MALPGAAWTSSSCAVCDSAGSATSSASVRSSPNPANATPTEVLRLPGNAQGKLTHAAAQEYRSFTNRVETSRHAGHQLPHRRRFELAVDDPRQPLLARRCEQ